MFFVIAHNIHGSNYNNFLIEVADIRHLVRRIVDSASIYFVDKFIDSLSRLLAIYTLSFQLYS